MIGPLENKLIELGQGETLVLHGGTLIDGTGAKAMPDVDVVIEGDRVQAVGQQGEIPLPHSSRLRCIDCTGKTLEDVQEPRPRQFIATLDLDRTFVHTNFNTGKVKKLLEEHRGEVEQEHYYPMESWYLLRAAKPGVRVRDLCKEYGIETLREYRHRSRREINAAREEGKRI